MWKWRIAQWLELKWWKRYTANKSKQDYLVWKTNYWKELFEKIGISREVCNADAIIDFGCGPFGLALLNETWQKQLVSLDPLVDSYEQELSFFSKSDYPHTTFIAQKMEDFSSEKKFNIVFCLNAINHVADIERAFYVLAKETSQNGKLVLGIDVHNFSFLKHIFRLIPGDALHPHQYDLKEYIAFLENNHFRVISKHKIKDDFIFAYWVVVAERA
jgi:SAM-dependent methyltransferase